MSGGTFVLSYRGKIWVGFKGVGNLVVSGGTIFGSSYEQQPGSRLTRLVRGAAAGNSGYVTIFGNAKIPDNAIIDIDLVSLDQGASAGGVQSYNVSVAPPVCGEDITLMSAVNFTGSASAAVLRAGF